jgi:hypothetical protein
VLSHGGGAAREEVGMPKRYSLRKHWTIAEQG